MAATLRRDPVCGMNVNPETAKAKLEHAGKVFYFCSSSCAQKFAQQPQKYAVASQAQEAATNSSLAVLSLSGHGKPSLDTLNGRDDEKDPVCGMRVSAERAAAKFDHLGSTYYFCSLRCAERFAVDPSNSSPRLVRRVWKIVRLRPPTIRRQEKIFAIPAPWIRKLCNSAPALAPNAEWP